MSNLGAEAGRLLTELPSAGDRTGPLLQWEDRGRRQSGGEPLEGLTRRRQLAAVPSC